MLNSFHVKETNGSVSNRVLSPNAKNIIDRSSDQRGSSNESTNKENDTCSQKDEEEIPV